MTLCILSQLFILYFNFSFHDLLESQLDCNTAQKATQKNPLFMIISIKKKTLVIPFLWNKEKGLFSNLLASYN